MKIYVDGDAVPKVVKEILYKAVRRVKIPLIFVANQHMYIPRFECISSIIVSAGADKADDKIVELVESGELVITADIPLADRVIQKQAYALNPKGTFYTEENIKERLAVRDLMDDLRGDGMIIGGSSGFGLKQKQAFANQLDRFLTKHMKT